MDLMSFKELYESETYTPRLKGEFLKEHGVDGVVERSQRYASWTLPVVFPTEHTSNEEMQFDYQSIGARAVTNLANKVMMALFQPSKPFFRMNLTQDQRKEIQETGLSLAQIDALLADAERAAMRELDAINARVVLLDILTLLIVTGNALLYMPEGENVRHYNLHDYVIKRDLAGEPVKIIFRETKSVAALSDELANIASQHNYNEESEVTLYTGIIRVGDRYKVVQELEDVCYCHKRIGDYTKETLPWVPLTWNLARGDDYGTGLVENYAGDFHTLSTLAEAVLDFTTVVTDVKNLVNPTGMTDVQVITESPSGAYVPGREEDLFSYTPNVGNAADFLDTQMEKVERRIAAAFLLNTAVTRDAERVTAEEIRLQAQELEGSLGGVYSRLASELQIPLAVRLLRSIAPVFAKIEPVIVTGLESLSRNSELNRTRAFLADLASLAELPETVQRELEFQDVIAVLGAGHGVDYKKIMKSEEKKKQDQKAAIEANAAAAGAEAVAVNQAQGQTSG